MMKADRELISRSRPSVVNENQFSNDVVECGSEIVETLPDYNAKPWRRRGNVSAKAEKPMVVSVSFGDNFTLIQTPLSILPYRCEMFFCPDDFLPDTVKGMHK
jgi:hypothetical protein